MFDHWSPKIHLKFLRAAFTAATAFSSLGGSEIGAAGAAGAAGALGVAGGGGASGAAAAAFSSVSASESVKVQQKKWQWPCNSATSRHSLHNPSSKPLATN